jgi:tryptophanyl-tRNA synthetase
MATDILMYKPQFVPVGQDQLPHLELTREIARRFNYLYGDFFPEPDAKLTESAKLPGLDGRKMSKSYQNCIYMSESMDTIVPKVKGMLTDTNRKRKNDPGDPDVCNMYPYHKLLTDEETRQEIRENCTRAKWGCFDCKKILLANLEKFLEPILKKRRELDNNPDMVWDILRQGNAAAREKAEKNMRKVRELIGFQY